MTFRLRVQSAPALNDGVVYDALVATLGFEERSTAVATRLAANCRRICAYDYQTVPCLSYEANAAFFSAFEVVRESPSAYRKSLVEFIQSVRASMAVDEATGERVTPRIAIDISSMDRDRLARTVLACTEDQSEPLQVDFFYAFGEFEAELVGSEGPVLVNRPMDGMEGWTSDPDAPVVCVLGIGFEEKLATAAIETIEPRQTVVLVPHGEDARYDDVVRKRNETLLSSGVVDAVHDYTVADMRQTIMDLNSSVSTWSRTSRVVIVPLGPKPFALAATLIAVANGHNVTVWRMSADGGRAPEERRSTGSIAGISVVVEPVAS